jgi:hypothetical protein
MDVMNDADLAENLVFGSIPTPFFSCTTTSRHRNYGAFYAWSGWETNMKLSVRSVTYLSACRGILILASSNIRTSR